MNKRPEIEHKQTPYVTLYPEGMAVSPEEAGDQLVRWCESFHDAAMQFCYHSIELRAMLSSSQAFKRSPKLPKR